MLSPFDLKRLESYANNMLDYHVILDLLPSVAQLYFEKRLGAELRLSAVQSSILLALGLQRKTVEEVEVRGSAAVSMASAYCIALFHVYETSARHPGHNEILVILMNVRFWLLGPGTAICLTHSIFSFPLFILLTLPL